MSDRIDSLAEKFERLRRCGRELARMNRERDGLRHQLLEQVLERAQRLRSELEVMIEDRALPDGKHSACTLEVAEVSCTMQWIPPGSFIVDGARPSRREVTLHDGFWMLEHPVTQELFQAVTGRNPSLFQHHDGPPAIGLRDNPPSLLTAGEPWRQRPVEQVSWFDAVVFCNELTGIVAAAKPSLGLTPCYVIEDDVRVPSGVCRARVMSVPDASGFRLPTEIEWEYGCRGLTTGTRAVASLDEESPANRGAWHDDVDRFARYAANSSRRTHCVGEMAPNPFGLFDMLGNVWEWCDDRVNCGEATVDGDGPPQCRNARGGGFYTSEPLDSGIALRFHASYFREDVGFRVVRKPSQGELLKQVTASLQGWTAFCSSFADLLRLFEPKMDSDDQEVPR